MREPERLLGSTGLTRELLASAKGDGPPEAGRRRAVLAAAAAAIASAQAANATAAGVTAGSVVSTMARLAVWKWVAIGALGATTVGAVVGVRPATKAPTKNAVTGPVERDVAPHASASDPPPPVQAPVGEPVVAPPARAAPAAPASAPKVVESSAGPSESAIAAHAPVASRLSLEIAALDRAKAVLARGDVAEALRQLDTYRASFPRGALAEEATALRIEALARAGRRDEARQALAELRKSHPESPLLESLAPMAGE
jgi:hypothetical protein